MTAACPSRLGGVTDAASTPRALVRWAWDTAVEMWHEFRDDRITDLAASTSFFTLLMIPAASLALMATLGSLEGFLGEDLAADARRASIDWVTDTFGSDGTLVAAVQDLFDTRTTGLATLGFFVALWALGRGFSGIIRAFDIAYDVLEGRTWLRLRLTALGLGAGTVAVAGGIAWLRWVVWPRLPMASELRVVLLPVLAVILVLWMATLYHIGPNHHTPWRYDLPGAALATVAWIVLAAGFAFYVDIVGRVSGVLGIVGAALLGFTLLYLMNISLLLGAELNEILARRAGVVQQSGGWRLQTDGTGRA